ncbi:ATP-binding protein [Rheinheimera sp. 4Y26]|uniref:PAS domain-containing sensor histidine kinase n=1 Tax=Rheinheimera sp. 4Y26 TaxID=2977811 RepID=UPI0021B0BB48|nr:ATP-binding protein [Rheinheimera sp. 4Y26]MCT6698032.1 ATP-binding protein [Rheinheimera sp. 4Y26]
MSETSPIQRPQTLDLQQRLNQIRHQFANSVWRGLALVAAIGTPISLSRALFSGWLPVYNIQLGVALLVLLLYALLNRLPLQLKTTLLMLVFWTVAVPGVITFGMASAGVWWLVASVVVAYVMYSAKLAFAVLCLSFTFLAVTALGFIQGWLTMPLDANIYLTEPMSWATYLIVNAIVFLILTRAGISYSQAQQAISQHQYRQWIDDLPLGLVVQDQQLQPYYFNKAAARMLGPLLQQQPEGTQLHFFHHASLSPYPAELMPAARALLGETSYIDDLAVGNGAPERRLQAWGRPGYDSNGNLAFGITVFEDITERKMAESQQLEQAARTSAILQHIRDAILTVSDSGSILSDNPALSRIFGYAEGQMTGQPLSLLLPAWQNLTAGTLTERAGSSHESEGRHADGHHFPVAISVSVIAGQQPAVFVVMLSDISERKRLEQMKNDFVSTVSHELRTPLTAIRGSLKLLTAKVLGELPPQVQDMLVIAEQNSQRLLRLINDILDMQKIEAGQMHFVFKLQDIKPVLQAAVQELSCYAVQYQVHFVLETELTGIPLRVDADRLMQVLANLLSNAAKFSPPGSEIKLTASYLNQHWLRLAVWDKGPGISAEFQQRIFQPFSQSDASNQRSYGGTGLGLTISKAIVEQHGGRLSFENNPTEGSVFYLDLPCPAATATEQGN